MKRILTRKSSGVRHHLPHRTRIKIPLSHRSVETMAAVKNELEYIPGVKDVQVNQRTGSVTIDHDEREDTLELVGAALDNIAEELFNQLALVEEIEFPGLSIVAHGIRKYLSRADEKVAAETNNVLDLKMLVPILFFGAGVVKTRMTSNWWGEVPAWVLFYYAYDSYMKFHGAGYAETMPVRVITSNGDGHAQALPPESKN